MRINVQTIQAPSRGHSRVCVFRVIESRRLMRRIDLFTHTNAHTPSITHTPTHKINRWGIVVKICAKHYNSCVVSVLPVILVKCQNCARSCLCVRACCPSVRESVCVFVNANMRRLTGGTLPTAHAATHLSSHVITPDHHSRNHPNPTTLPPP